MKKLIRFVLVLALGVIIGYVFNNPIDTKLKAKYGEEKVEKFKVGVEYIGKKGADVGKAAFEAGKQELDSTKTE